MRCERVSPFLISKTTNNGPLKLRHFRLMSGHYTFYTNLVQCMLISSPFFGRATNLKKHIIYSPFFVPATNLKNTLIIIALFSFVPLHVHARTGKWARTLNLISRTNSAHVKSFLSQTKRKLVTWTSTIQSSLVHQRNIASTWNRGGGVPGRGGNTAHWTVSNT